jgi:hypothetical protein
MRSKNEVLCAAAGSLAAERSETEKNIYTVNNKQFRTKCMMSVIVTIASLEESNHTLEQFRGKLLVGQIRLPTYLVCFVISFSLRFFFTEKTKYND